VDEPGTETSGYVAAGTRQLYVTFHEPSNGRLPRDGLLVLGPFGEERKCAYRTLVRLARACADAGLAVARFDYGGTGESTGRHADISLSEWVDEAAIVAGVLKRRFGLERLGVAGVRLGANLAVRLAGVADLSTLVLVEPILLGASYLSELQRRKQIKEMMGGGTARTAATDMEATWKAGKCVDFDGFDIGPGLAGELKDLALETELATVPDACRSLLLRVGALRDFPTAWRSAVERVTHSPGNKAGIIREKPFWGQIEYFETDRIQDAVLDFIHNAKTE